MRHPVEQEHTTLSGERTRILGWASEGDQAILIHHGLGEHMGRYQTFADCLPVRALWGYDARGHGAYTEHRGRVGGVDELADDLARMIPEMLERSGASAVVLFGHSMGAAVVLHYLLHHSPHPAIRGVALSAPAVAVELDLIGRVKIAVGRVLAKVAPEATLSSGLDKDGISSLPAEVERYRADPLVHDRISLALGRSLIDEVPKLVPRTAAITLPVLLLHGADDAIALPRGSDELARVIPGAQVKIFPGARHEVHHDVAATEYFETLAEFVGMCLGG